MNVKLLNHIGFCEGVNLTLTKLDEIILNNPSKRIICFGQIVHNKLVLDKYKNVKFLPLNIDNINALNEDDIVVFSAHGHDVRFDSLIKNKTYDLLCPKLKIMHNFILNNKNEQIIFIGENNHDEVKSALSLSSNIHLYDLDNKLDYSKFDKEKLTYVLNQSTLSSLQLQSIYDEIKENMKNIKIIDDICKECQIRQEEILSIDEDCDNLVIVSDKNSANGNRLLYLANLSQPNKNNILVENVDQLKLVKLKSGTTILASATSTAMSTVQLIKEYLESL